MFTEIKDHTLYFDGCNTVELAEKYGTPLFVYSESDIVSRFNQLKETFLNRYDNTRAAYAAKAFCTVGMFKLVEREGLCIDVVSGGELYTAVKANFPPERVEFNGNNKQRWEIELAVEYGIGRIIIDGLQELALIEEVCRERGKKMNVLYRITPGVKSDTHDYIVTGKKDSKFGIPLDDDVIYPAIEAAIRSEYVTLSGFHFHVGSQLFDNDSHLAALETSLNLVKESKERYHYEMTELNVGGGFGARYIDEDRKPYEYFLDPIMRRVEEFSAELGIARPAVVIEPGRSIVAEAGITLYQVGSIKDIHGIRKYVSVDGGMTDNIRPALYQSVYDGVVAGKADFPKDDTITVCGKCCESGDILIRDLAAAEAETGDIFCIFSTGAYGYSMSNNYNKNLIPAVVLVKEGRDELLVKRQTCEQMIQNERIPDSLK